MYSIASNFAQRNFKIETLKQNKINLTSNKLKIELSRERL